MISERAFEDAIEATLLQSGPDDVGRGASEVREHGAPFGYDGIQPGGYHRRGAEDYDRELCLLPNDVVDFVLATQPREWERLSQHYGAQVKDRFLRRLSSEIERRGALDVLRNGVKDMGCSFRLAWFRPASRLNEETRRLYAANFFAVARQIRYSTKNEKSLDMVLFLNGIPIFSIELKNPLTGQTVEDAHPAIQDRPRPARAAVRLRPLPCPLRRRSGSGLRHHAPRRRQDALPAVQPGEVRRGRQSAGAADAGRPCHRLPLGRDLGARQRPRPGAPVHP